MPEEATITEPTPTEGFTKSLFAEADAARAAKEPVIAAKMQAAQETPDTPPPKEPAKPAETPKATAPDPDADLDAGKRAPKTEDWKRLKQGFKKTEEEYKGKLSTYEKELAELKKEPVHNKKIIEELTQERDKYKLIHDKVLLTQLPDFHKQYQAKIESVLTPLKAILPPEAAQQVGEALMLPDGQHKRQIISNLISDMDDWTKGEIIAANGKIRDISAERDGRVAETHKTLSELAEQQATAEKAQAESMGKVFDETVERAKKQMPLMQLREGEGAEEWNKGVEERAKIAQHIYAGKLSPAERAEAALWAANGEVLLKELSLSHKEIASLRETVAKLQSATPGLTSGTQGATPEGGAKDRPFSSQFNKWVREAGGH